MNQQVVEALSVLINRFCGRDAKGVMRCRFLDFAVLGLFAPWLTAEGKVRITAEAEGDARYKE